MEAVAIEVTGFPTESNVPTGSVVFFSRCKRAGQGRALARESHRILPDGGHAMPLLLMIFLAFTVGATVGILGVVILIAGAAPVVQTLPHEPAGSASPAVSAR